MIEALKAKVVDAKLQAADAARELAESRCRADVDIARLQDELLKLRDRYDRSDCINCVLNSELLCALVRVTDLQIWGIGTKEVNRLQYSFLLARYLKCPNG